MPKKYHIALRECPPRFTPVGKSGIIDFRENCARCHPCGKKACIYNVYEKRDFDSRLIIDSIDYLCKGCFRCIQQCKKGLLKKSINPEYLKMGDDYWTPEIISANWAQAETGKIPVSGAGYGGPFSGPGFDSMWTDMSEIVRPTRDGIHGREYINTSVDIGRKVTMLEFDDRGEITSSLPHLLEIPLPMVMSFPDFGPESDSVRIAVAQAAAELGTFILMRAENYDDSLEAFNQHIIPQCTIESFEMFQDRIKEYRAIEIMYAPGTGALLKSLKKTYSDLVIVIKVPFDGKEIDVVEELLSHGVEVIHLYADDHGNEIGKANPRFIKDMLREIHGRLIDSAVRDEVTLIASGGIAMAEHMAKAIICGADAVVVDIALLIALECRLCRNCERGRPCPVAIDDIEPRWGTQRVKNLAGAWRNQLLEVLGAMGIREARRLRGEIGRAMFFEEMEKETFGEMFGDMA